MSARRSRAAAGTALAALAVILLAFGWVTPAAPSGVSTAAEPTCPATRVQEAGRSTVVRAGPFVGYIAPRYDVVDGGFRLHVGPLRDPATGLSQKIPWFLRGRPPGTTTSLVVVGTRISPRPQRQFRQTFRSSSRRFWPTNISPPLAGCWRLQLRSGRVTGSLTALVVPVTAPPPPAEQPVACTGPEVEQLTNRFIGAFNAGDLEALDNIFAHEPDFEWYSTLAPGERLTPLANDRASLIPYFRDRHALGEQLVLRSFTFNGNDPGSRPYGNFVYRLTRSADDLAPTPYHGKGASLCYRSRADVLFVWSMGAETG
jgi:hypothetical protein